jgi:hemoglobin
LGPTPCDDARLLVVSDADVRALQGNPVAVHLRIDGMEPRLFDRWLELFSETCGELFDEDLAETLRAKALRIAESLKLALFYRPDRPWPRRVS